MVPRPPPPAPAPTQPPPTVRPTSAPAFLTREPWPSTTAGGFTWAEIWYLEDRQPEIMVGTCAHALSSD
eukprot:COSAG01_NODE_62425_length_284_cov_1.691892_1_plen_68_part_10